MENKLNQLSHVLDEEMSHKKVFTEKDEAAVLKRIQELQVVKMKPKQRNYVPQVLTAAVVAGIAFASYEVMNHEKSLNTAEHKKEEVKEQFAAPNEQFSEPKATATYDPDTMTLDIKGSVVNGSEHDGVPFKMKLVLKNEVLAEAAGESEVLVDVPEGVMRAGDPFTFASSIPLNAQVDRENLENSVEVVFYDDLKVLSSYVVGDLVVNEPAPPTATTINVAPVQELRAGESQQLDVQVTFEKNGTSQVVDVLEDDTYRQNVTFTVQDENVATVNNNGTIQVVESPSANETVVTVRYKDQTGQELVHELPIKIKEINLETMTWEELVETLKFGMSMSDVEKILGKDYEVGKNMIYLTPTWSYQIGVEKGYTYTPPPGSSSKDSLDAEGLRSGKVKKILVITWESNNTLSSFTVFTSENGKIVRKSHFKPGQYE